MGGVSTLPKGIILAENGVYLKLFVQPRASKNRMIGWHDDRIKLALTAPPVEGAANKAVIEFFAKLCKLPKSAISITAGETSRQKTIFIQKKPENILKFLSPTHNGDII